MNLSFRRLLIWISLTLFFFFAAGQISSQNLNIRTYTYKDGLPTHSFFDAVQDTTGRMWFACSKGLTVYDGYEWKLLSVDDGVPMANYIKIKLDDQGRIWALPKAKKHSIIAKTNDGWTKLPPITNYNLLKGQTVIDFEIYANSKKNKSIAISSDSIYIYNSGKWTPINKRFNSTITFYSLHKYMSDILVCTSEGIFIVDRLNEVSKLKIDNWKNSESVFTLTSPQWKDHELESSSLLLFADTWLGEIAKNKLTTLTKGFSDITSVVHEHYSLVSDQYGNIYWGNNAVIFYYNLLTKNLHILDKDDGLVTNGAMSIFVDNEENKWICSPRGISRIMGTPFINFNKKSGLLSDEVSAIEEMSDERLVIGHNQGLTILSTRHPERILFSNYHSPNPGDTRVLDLVSSDRQIYFAATFLGVGKINSKLKLTWLTKPSKVYFSALTKDKYGNVFVSSHNQLSLINSNLLEPTFKINFPVPSTAREIFYNENSFYLSTNGMGIVKIKNRETTFINAAEDHFNNTYAVFEQNDSTILVGTKGGLCKIQDSILVPHSIENLTIEDPIYFIEAGNKSGSIWFGLDKGAIYWEDGKSRHYDPNSGLAGYETNRHAGFLDSKGNFWIGTDNGLSMFAAGNENIVQPDPLIDLLYLEDMGFNRYDVENNITLSHDNNSFSIHFRCLSFIDESNILFYPKLLDDDGEVIEEFNTKEKSARFSNLLPGDYRIELSAIKTNSIKSRVIRSNIITIESPFYNTIWFYFLIVIFFGFIAYSINRVISQKKYSKLLEKEVSERTAELENAEMMKSKAIYENIESDRRRISRDLHDGLGQILTSAKLKLETFQLSNSIDDQQFEGSLDLINNTGQTLRKIVHNLHPLEIEKYGLDVSIKMLCDDLNSDSQISISSDIQKYNRGISKKTEVMVFRIIQEAMNNAIKHSSASEIKVVFSETINSLVITITDNGTGFNYSKKEKSELQKSHFGLVNMNQRANFIGAELEIISKINLGTTVKLEVPLNDR